MPYDISTLPPSSRPDNAADPTDLGPTEVAASARAAMPHAVTTVMTASADTAMNTAAGLRTRNGAARRAISSAPSARTVTSTAEAVEAASSVTTTPAARSPPNPSRTMATKNSSIAGGWPATCVGQLSSAA